MKKWKGYKICLALILCICSNLASISYASDQGPGALLEKHAGTGVENEKDRAVLENPDIVNDTDQVIIVRGMGGSSISLVFYCETESGIWEKRIDTDGVWGLNGGTYEKREGDKKTPLGVYRFNKAFGILDDPGTVMPYYKLTDHDYWVDDPDSQYYNRMVNTREVKKDWNSAEHLIQSSPYYNYVLSLTYNEDAVPGKGSAIFLHCTAEGYPGSSGCICIPQEEMKTLLQCADEKTKIVILEN